MGDLIERLRTELVSANKHGDPDLADLLRDTLAALEAAREDAERYRWLRDNCYTNAHDERDAPHAVIMVQWFDGKHICRMHPGHTPSVGIPSLDTTIDQARGKGGGAGKGEGE